MVSVIIFITWTVLHPIVDGQSYIYIIVSRYSWNFRWRWSYFCACEWLCHNISVKRSFPYYLTSLCVHAHNEPTHINFFFAHTRDLSAAIKKKIIIIKKTKTDAFIWINIYIYNRERTEMRGHNVVIVGVREAANQNAQEWRWWNDDDDSGGGQHNSFGQVECAREERRRHDINQITR